jgi:PhnB protein
MQGTQAQPTTVEPYLFFYGRCDEAVAFYTKALGATDVELMRFKDAPEKPPPGAVPAGWENKVMHGVLKVGATTIMVSDANTDKPAGFSGFALAISVRTEAEADRYFNALSDGGKVNMPIGKTFFSPRFGSVTDKFGIQWMIVTMQ